MLSEVLIRHAGGACVVAAAHMPESFRVFRNSHLNSSPNSAFGFCGPSSRTLPAWHRTGLKLLLARCGGLPEYLSEEDDIMIAPSAMVAVSNLFFFAGTEFGKVCYPPPNSPQVILIKVVTNIHNM